MTEIRIGSYSLASFRDAGALDHGEGERQVSSKISFFPPFPREDRGMIKVHLGITGIDAETGEAAAGIKNVRLRQFVTEVDEEGFTAKIETWGSSGLWNVEGFYIAVVG